MLRVARLVICLVSATLLAGVGRAAEQPAPGAAELTKLGLTAADWPWWRGPQRNGWAAADQDLATEWGEERNILWKVPVPGRGHGSPTVVGDQVFFATADEAAEVQSVVCCERATGKARWQTEIHRGGFAKGGNQKSSHASSTPACDGERIFINFLNAGAVHTTALSRDGKILWQTKITDYVLHQGFGSSPAIYGALVIVSADNKGGGAIAALERATGKIVWKIDRPKFPNYASPMILPAAGRDQVILTGCNQVQSLDPLTGAILWETAGATTECVTSSVTDGVRVFTSGGYPKNHVSAVAADGSGKLVWENTSRVYVPSMLVRHGYLYAVTDAGVAMCWKSDTGAEVWKQRLSGTFSASPVLVGDRILASNEEGTTFVFAADPAAYEAVAENKLGDEVFASPVVCGGRLYIRAARQVDGRRQEFLYCVGRPE